jgi:hypothetical protein
MRRLPRPLLRSKSQPAPRSTRCGVERCGRVQSVHICDSGNTHKKRKLRERKKGRGHIFFVPFSSCAAFKQQDARSPHPPAHTCVVSCLSAPRLIP